MFVLGWPGVFEVCVLAHVRPLVSDFHVHPPTPSPIVKSDTLYGNGSVEQARERQDWIQSITHVGPEMPLF